MFDVLMIDPPWPKRKGGLRKVRPQQGRELDYQTMSTDDIFSLLDTDIFSMASKVHSAFVWTVDQFWKECEEQMEQRGYSRHCRFVWDKGNGVAPAFTVRFSHEYLIWFYRPQFQPIAENMRGKFPTVFREPAREHSRKPEFAYYMVSAFYPESKKIDVFSRQQRSGCRASA